MSTWIVRPRPNSRAQLRLFCFPYAGGGASAFWAWPDGLPSAIEVCPIRLPGRESRLRESAFRRLPPLVRALASALEPYLDRPFAFFGHSMGALVGFELTRELCRRQGPTPVHLFAAGRRAPQIPDLRPPLHPMPEAELVRTVRERYNGLPDAVMQNADLMALALPILRADFELVETYLYDHYHPLDCPIAAFGGDREDLSQQDLAAWQEQTCGAFAVHRLPGGHFFLESARAPLLEIVSQYLIQALEGEGHGC